MIRSLAVGVQVVTAVKWYKRALQSDLLSMVVVPPPAVASGLLDQEDHEQSSERSFLLVKRRIA